SSAFGNRLDPFTGLPDFHSGLDISTPIGTKIQSPADGVVTFCGDKGGYGNAVVIDHGFGILTRYAHLAGFNVKAGQRVRRGDPQLAARTVDFKERLAKGQPLDDLLPEAFAVTREAGRRVLNMRHFDVQLIGGLTLHRGTIAEMKTGEGKTLVATLAAYLNAL